MRISLAIFMAAVLTTAAVAQTPPATVSLIVTDNHGNHVTGLARDEFSVAVGGKNAELSSFSENRGASNPRRIAVLFDTTTLSLAARRNVIDSFRAYVAQSLRPDDRVTVLTLSQSLDVLTPWTADREAIDKALNRAAEQNSAPMAGDREAAEKRMRELIVDIQTSQHTGFLNFDSLIDAARAYAAAAYRDGRQSLALIDDALTLFTPRATKNILLIAGTGLPRKAGAELFQYLETVRLDAEKGLLGPDLQRNAGRSSPMGEAGAYDLTPVLEEVAHHAWIRGVPIYTLIPQIAESNSGSARVEATRFNDTLSAFTNVANRSAGYIVLGNDSGGAAITGHEAKDALTQINSDMESFYAASFVPPQPLTSRRQIAVKSKNGYNVRVMRGAAATSLEQEIQSRVIAHHVIKPDTNDLGISLEAAPPVVDGQRRHVALKIMIPIKNLKLVQEGEQVTGGFTVYIATGDAVGNASGVNKQTQQIRWPSAALQQAGDKKLTFAVDVVLDPGRSQISVGVLDNGSQQTGYERVKI